MTSIISMTRRDIFVTATAAAALAAAGPAMAAAVSGTVLVTGANRGLGLEFARQYAAKGYRVIATARQPDKAAELQALAKSNAKVTVEKLDVNDLAAIDVLAAKYKGQAIDVLLNNAGTAGDPRGQSFGKIDYASFDDVMRTNVRGPLKMSEAFVENVAMSREKKIAVLGSTEGSIGMVDAGRIYFYRASKAAMNMEMRNLAFALKNRGVLVGIVNPGAAATDMMRGAPIPLRDPAASVKDVIAVLDGLTPEKSGQFLNYDGTTIAW